MEFMPKTDTPILVVDDDVGLLNSIRAILASAGMPEPALVSDGRRVMELAREHHFHLVLLDLIMPHISGMEILRQLRGEFPAIECVIITAIDEVSSAVQAMKYGAYDYLVKPIQTEKLIIVINNAVEKYNLRHRVAMFEDAPSFSDLRDRAAFQEMLAEDELMALVFKQAEVNASTDYNLLITGETGVGKELLARIVHRLSHRSDGPFVAVSMSAFSKALFEAEFFGHVKGAFTGANAARKGFFEEAQGGTLFLDEITEIETDLQRKLLRVIEERELYRLGSTEAKKVDIRTICTTNRDIHAEVNEGRFRSDLYYRLNVCRINIPPLRERKRDILPLANHFLGKHATKNRKEIYSLSPDMAECLLNYPFPGNVRELENIIASAVVAEKGNILTLSTASDLLPRRELDRIQEEELRTLEEVEKRHIYRVMEAARGNRTRAAEILGIGLRTLQRKLKVFEEQPTTSK